MDTRVDNIDTKAIEVWDICKEYLKTRISEVEFEMWITPIEPVKIEGEKLTIRVPSSFFYEWIEEHYAKYIVEALKSIFGKGAILEYQVVLVNDENARSLTARSTPAEYSTDREKEIFPEGCLPLNPRFTFTTFIEGDCNKLARSAGITVSSAPGKNPFNPLLIYGKTGVGKTHLLHAIGNEIKRQHPELKVILTSGETFLNAFVRMARTSHIEEFKQHFYKADVLLVDDIHQLAGKEKTQEVFFHIFNHLYQLGKQIVLTSDQPPVRMSGFSERLLSRFRWALVAEIEPPDYETRLAILRFKAKQEGISLPDHVLALIAEKVQDSIRDLEGALVGLLAEITVFGEKEVLNEGTLLKLLEKYTVGPAFRFTLEHVVQKVSKATGISAEQIRSNSRQRTIVEARDMVMWLGKEALNLSLTEIGRFFGCDHSRVSHAIRRFETKLKNSVSLRKLAEKLLKELIWGGVGALNKIQRPHPAPNKTQKT